MSRKELLTVSANKCQDCCKINYGNIANARIGPSFDKKGRCQCTSRTLTNYEESVGSNDPGEAVAGSKAEEDTAGSIQRSPKRRKWMWARGD